MKLDYITIEYCKSLLLGEEIYNYNLNDYIMPCDIFLDIKKYLLFVNKLEIIKYDGFLSDDYSIKENSDIDLFMIFRSINNERKINDFEKQLRKNYHCWHFILDDTFNTYVMGLKI